MKNYCCILRLHLKYLDIRLGFVSRTYNPDCHNNVPTPTKRINCKQHCIADLIFLMNDVIIVELSPYYIIL